MQQSKDRIPSPGLLAVTVIANLLFFGLACLGWGGPGAYLAHPARVAALAVVGVASLASLFTGINLGGCYRADAREQWRLVPLVVLSLLIAVVPSVDDRLDLATIDGDATRWSGLALMLVGATLRVGPMFVLGRRFTWPLAGQVAHPLVTTGFYRHVRHPSYLGAFLGGIGWVLVSRSGIGLVLVALLWPAFLPVVRAEEALLDQEYGQEYRDYRSRSWRLIPLVY